MTILAAQFRNEQKWAAYCAKPLTTVKTMHGFTRSIKNSFVRLKGKSAVETELCNMCMITDAQDRVLVQERLPKPSNPWSGLTFPGGHVEPGETVVASVIREVQEETGLTVSNLQNCGYIQWYNPVKQSQYFVFLFKTSTFSGELTGSVEGSVKWMTLDEMLAGSLAPNMTKYLAVFQNENIPQAYGISGQGLKIINQNGDLIHG